MLHLNTRRSFPLVLVLVSLSTIFTTAFAEIPRMISYQGKVTDSGGAPVSDGTYAMRFRIYDASTGGNLEWDSGAQPVQVTDGVSNVLLGDSPQPSIELEFNEDYWLDVTFEGVGQTPRQRLASTGYAYMASGLIPGTGVYGTVTSSPYAVIHGANEAVTGIAHGISGVSASTNGSGVHGTVTATVGSNFGVYGEATSTLGYGVYGISWASAGDTKGVYGGSISPTGTGVYGVAIATVGATIGVHGRSLTSEGIGVYGETETPGDQSCGVLGQVRASGRAGVYGWASYTVGNATGVWGRTDDTTGGHGVYYEGGLAGSGSKSCIVKTTRGPTALYCQESPECWFEDFGEGRLIRGRCRIELDALFLETVTIDAVNPMKVFLQPCDESCLDLVVKRGPTGFDVTSPTNPQANGVFMYRVVAKRKGFEDKRLDYCKAAEIDSYLYPELSEKEREMAGPGGRGQ